MLSHKRGSPVWWDCWWFVVSGVDHPHLLIEWLLLHEELSSSNSDLQPRKRMHAVQCNSSLSSHTHSSNNCLQLHKASKCSKCPSCLMKILKKKKKPSKLSKKVYQLQHNMALATLRNFNVNKGKLLRIKYKVSPETGLDLNCCEFFFVPAESRCCCCFTKAAAACIVVVKNNECFAGSWSQEFSSGNSEPLLSGHSHLLLLIRRLLLCPSFSLGLSFWWYNESKYADIGIKDMRSMFYWRGTTPPHIFGKFERGGMNFPVASVVGIWSFLTQEAKSRSIHRTHLIGRPCFINNSISIPYWGLVSSFFFLFGPLPFVRSKGKSYIGSRWQAWMKTLS